MHGPIFRPTEPWFDQQQILPCRAQAEAHPEPEWGHPQIQSPTAPPEFGNIIHSRYSYQVPKKSQRL